MEFFTNIWNWFVANKDSILTVVSSAEFVALVSAIIGITMSKKGMIENSSLNKELKAILKETRAENTELKKENEKIRVNLEKVLENTETVLTKTSATVEALSVVYSSSIKNPETRDTVNNILTNAKFAETKTRAELVKALEDLQAKNEIQVEEAKKTVEKAKKTLSISDNTVLRG